MAKYYRPMQNVSYMYEKTSFDLMHVPLRHAAFVHNLCKISNSYNFACPVKSNISIIFLNSSIKTS